MDWESVKKEYETTNISLIDLAAKHDIKYPTIKSRKQRQKWTKNASMDASQSALAIAEKRRSSGRYGNKNAVGHGAPLGNKNALGNKGGPPLGSQNALKHGLYAKYLPKETIELAEQFAKTAPIDILWGNICIKYAAIVRAQQIMYVKDKDELIGYVKSKDEKSTTYEFQFAWDRQATFMAAQSRAMQTLSNMIKQYDDLCRSELATEEQRARIDKLKSEIEVNKDKSKSGDDDDGNLEFTFDRKEIDNES